MRRKKSTPPAATPDNSGFDVPPPTDQPQPPPSSIIDPPSSPQVPGHLPTTNNARPSPINATPIVKVPKHAFLRLQRMQTEKAKQEQLRQLARRHPVIRELVNEIQNLRQNISS